MGHNNINGKDADISLRDVILFTKEFFGEILRSWYWVLIFIALFFGYYFITEKMTPMRYQATTKYIVNEDNTGGGMGGVLGQLGFGGSNSENNDRILEIAASRNLIEKTIYEKIEFNGDSTYVGNVIIELYKLNEIWSQDDKSRMNYRLDADNPHDLSRLGKSVSQLVYKKIINGLGKEPLMTNVVDSKTGIFKMDIATVNEKFTIELANLLYDNLKEFYDVKTTSKQQATLDILINKKDSIETLLNNTTYRLAKYKESNRANISQIVGVEERKMEQEIIKYRVVLNSLAQNEELADFNLKNKRPFFEIIEDPMIPLRRLYMKTSTMIKYALIFGSFLSLGFIFLRMLYRKAMVENT